MEDSSNKLSFSLQLLSTIYIHRKALIIFNSVIAILTIIILIITPKEYKANALVSLESKKDVFQIPSLLKDLPFGLGGFSGENAEKYIRYCSSRRVLDSVIYKFDLNKFYNSKFQEDTYKKIRGNLEIWDNTDGTISISFISTDKKLSADIVAEIYNQLK
ncbi:MAG: hypothetical protein KAJ16_03190, partial [Calditrichia bacterium]|nr:hypothetical protein [Calditrichia bacterium]